MSVINSAWVYNCCIILSMNSTVYPYSIIYYACIWFAKLWYKYPHDTLIGTPLSTLAVLNILNIIATHNLWHSRLLLSSNTTYPQHIANEQYTYTATLLCILILFVTSLCLNTLSYLLWHKNIIELSIHLHSFTCGHNQQKLFTTTPPTIFTPRTNHTALLLVDLIMYNSDIIASHNSWHSRLLLSSKHHLFTTYS